jgi:hypothetical protein
MTCVLKPEYAMAIKPEVMRVIILYDRELRFIDTGQFVNKFDRVKKKGKMTDNQINPFN